MFLKLYRFSFKIQINIQIYLSSLIDLCQALNWVITAL